MISEVINKILDLKFICVEIDDDAHSMFKYKDVNKALDNVSHNCGFISFNRIEALKQFNQKPTVYNHHLVIHWVLVDNMVYHLSMPLSEKRLNSIRNIIEETVRCSDSSDLYNVLDALLKSCYTELRVAA